LYNADQRLTQPRTDQLFGNRRNLAKLRRGFYGLRDMQIHLIAVEPVI
jgi:hypothetical protein